MKLKDPSALPRGMRRFVAYWLRDLVVGYDKRGFRSLIPIRLLICTGVGVATGVFVDANFLSDQGNLIQFYAAILTLNAILLAVCWASFSRIFEIMSDDEFGPWLRQRQMDGYYGFYVEFIQLTQMLAVLAAVGALVLAVIGGLPPLLPKLALGATITLSLYAGWWSSGGVRVMQDLADNRAVFRDQRASGRVRDIGPRPRESGEE